MFKSMKSLGLALVLSSNPDFLAARLIQESRRAANVLVIDRPSKPVENFPNALILKEFVRERLPIYLDNSKPVRQNGKRKW